MVDTINPNTNQPDGWDEHSQPPVESTAADDRFYGGFDKPDETKINLADTSSPTATPQPTQPVADVAPVQPTEVKHTSYVNTADRINWRGVLVIIATGLLVTLIVGIGLYFGVSAINKAKLSEQQVELDSIKQEIADLDVTPSPLELPRTVTPPVEAPVVVPVETPAETPVEDEDKPTSETANG